MSGGQSLHEPPPPLSGVLRKQNPQFEWLFQQRFVVVRDFHLEWYGSELAFKEGSGRVARGFVNLAATRCVVQAEGLTSFSIGPEGGVWTHSSLASSDARGSFTGGATRVLVFDTSGSQFSRDRWMRAIRSHMNLPAGEERISPVPAFVYESQEARRLHGYAARRASAPDPGACFEQEQQHSFDEARRHSSSASRTEATEDGSRSLAWRLYQTQVNMSNKLQEFHAFQPLPRVSGNAAKGSKDGWGDELMRLDPPEIPERQTSEVDLEALERALAELKRCGLRDDDSTIQDLQAKVDSERRKRAAAFVPTFAELQATWDGERQRRSGAKEAPEQQGGVGLSMMTRSLEESLSQIESRDNGGFQESLSRERSSSRSSFSSCGSGEKQSCQIADAPVFKESLSRARSQSVSSFGSANEDEMQECRS